MSESDPTLACPVCRARQPLQASCRRCEADLQLYVKALQSLRLAEQHVAEARSGPDELRRHTAQRYLDWLRPGAYHAGRGGFSQ